MFRYKKKAMTSFLLVQPKTVKQSFIIFLKRFKYTTTQFRSACFSLIKCIPYNK